jgi:3-deoxy-manno-octulosonate cytidylyltransferase (CMP-KDO synthetase)
MTSPEHSSGTDRIAEAVAAIEADIVVNIQGDEPLISPSVIDSLAKALVDDRETFMATVIKPFASQEDIENPNIVKVVVDRNGFALYFSRSVIPYNRDQDKKRLSEGVYYKHLGLYAYRKEFLLQYKNLPVSKLEMTEKLEQLRALEAGYKIKTVVTDQESAGVDTPEDLKRIEEFLKKQQGHL